MSVHQPYHRFAKSKAVEDPITDKGKASKKGRLTVQRAADTTGNEEARLIVEI